MVVGASVSLRKPDAGTVKNTDQLLTVLVGLYEGVQALQAAQNTSIRLLGALAADPAMPPAGVVFIYTLAGSLKARTATGITVLAA